MLFLHLERVFGLRKVPILQASSALFIHLSQLFKGLDTRNI